MWCIIVDEEQVYNKVVVGPFETNQLAQNYAKVVQFKQGTYKIEGIYKPHVPSLKIAERNIK